MPATNATRSSAATTAAARELVMTRVFDAPRELVWKAWTDPKHLAQWWGPHSFSNPICELDVRKGGAIRIHMRGPDGTIYPTHGAFNEVARPERLAFTLAVEDQNGNYVFETLTTVTFAEERGKTKLTMNARVVNATDEAAPYLQGMEEGWSQSLERLKEVATPTADHEIIATRIFDAPRELVFKMWTDPQHIANWWGPKGFRNTIHEMDVRPGGVWRFIMHGPDGRDYNNKVVYVDVVKPERIVYDHESGPPFRMTVTFAEQGKMTKVTVHMVFESATLRDRTIKEFGAVEGLHQTLGRLAEELQKMPGKTQQPFVISRTFDAPRDLMWKAWTEPERMGKWFGPKGVKIFHSKNDLRPGGVYHYGMRTADGKDMWGKWVYREIVKPERLVFVNSFSDEKGGLTRHPLAPTWPQEMLTTITFTEQQGKTTVTVRWEPINASEAELETFDTGRDGMKQGWSGTFEQLADYLATAR